jgi:hypothetical protein
MPALVSFGFILAQPCEIAVSCVRDDADNMAALSPFRQGLFISTAQPAAVKRELRRRADLRPRGCMD